MDAISGNSIVFFFYLVCCWIEWSFSTAHTQFSINFFYFNFSFALFLFFHWKCTKTAPLFICQCSHFNWKITFQLDFLLSDFIIIFFIYLLPNRNLFQLYIFLFLLRSKNNFYINIFWALRLYILSDEIAPTVDDC